MEMEIMLPPASPGDPAENGSHLANADGDSGSFCSGSDGTPERFVGRFIAKKIGRVTAKSPTPSIIDRRRHRTQELSATAKWRLSGIVSGAPTAAAGSPLRSPFGEQNFSTSLLAYSAIRKSLAFSEGEGAALLLRGILSRRRDAPRECQAGCSGSRREQSSGTCAVAPQQI
ncbi:hypothetical protein ALC57_17067 [Trachymyrmex cornetzi]|uniref:Uncharacterized protein n=1 Tax=Trachymyrmex cornetzi TaxID=471704 RepID=A0A151ITX1_9HYME|nr:hypothetical protein ALC57_17067 [Trachymyrmex cornetzi]